MKGRAEFLSSFAEMEPGNQSSILKTSWVMQVMLFCLHTDHDCSLGVLFAVSEPGTLEVLLAEKSNGS